MDQARTIRYLEILGVAIVIVAMFLPFGLIPTFHSGISGAGDLVDGGYSWRNALLFDFLTTSGGTVIAALLLALGLLMVLAKAGGQVLVIVGATSIVLIAFAEGTLFPLPLGSSILVLALGSMLCSSGFIAKELEGAI